MTISVDLNKKNSISLAQSLLAIISFLFLFLNCVKYYDQGVSGFTAWLGANGGKASFGGGLFLFFIILLLIIPLCKVFLEKQVASFRSLLNYIIIGIAANSIILLLFGGTRLMVNVNKTVIKNIHLAFGAVLEIFLMVCIGGASAVDEFVLK